MDATDILNEIRIIYENIADVGKRVSDLADMMHIESSNQISDLQDLAIDSVYASTLAELEI